MTRRLRECVERWPECSTGAFDPRCCRFPKSCSATVYGDGTDESLLETARWEAEKLDPGPHTCEPPSWAPSGLLEAFGGAGDVWRCNCGRLWIVRQRHTADWDRAPSVPPPDYED